LNKLRGLLGLTGYYHNFVNNCGQIIAPLTTLLKKELFSWTEEPTKAFEKIEAMCTTLVLATPKFTKKIIVDCDSLGHGIGVFFNARRNAPFL